MKVYVSNDTKSVLSLSTNLYCLLFKLSNDLPWNHVSTRINKFIIIIIISVLLALTLAHIFAHNFLYNGLILINFFLFESSWSPLSNGGMQ